MTFNPATRTPQTIIIGIGNEFRNDDAAGIIAVRTLQKILPDILCEEQSGEGTSLMERWKNFEKIIIIDAVSSGADAGTIFRINAQTKTIPSNFFNYSTHKFSLAEAVELSRTLGELPSRFLIYGIEGKNFSAGEIISAEVLIAVEIIVKEIAETITSL
ncbi:MAG: hydrogenase maturation protease [Bacteroidota bacterium]